MATLGNLTTKCLSSTSELLSKPNTSLTVIYRNASKKTGTTTQNAGNARAKHRGWKVQDGNVVHTGGILATQRTVRWHPGLNVGIGRKTNLYAIHPGKVVVTCEKPNFDWTHTFIRLTYGEKHDIYYKKYFNVIPEPQHRRFKLVDKV